MSNTTPNFGNTDTIGGSEPSVALNPANPSQVVITAFSLNSNTSPPPDPSFWSANQNAPLWYSTDGGSTWTKEFTITHPPGQEEGPCPCDQTVDYGRNGTLFGTFLINGDPPTSFKKFNVVSGDTTNPAQAASWQWNGNPVQLTNNAHEGKTGPTIDQPWLLVNRDPTSEGQDDAWVAYDDFAPSGGKPDAPLAALVDPPLPPNAQVAVSSNATPPNFTVDNTPGPMPNAASNPGLRLAKDPRNGWMYALWQTTTGETNPHSSTLHLNRSTDGGATWTLDGNADGQELPEGRVDDGFNNKSEVYRFGKVNALFGGVHHAAVDPTNGDVYVAYGNDNAGTGVGNQLLIRRLTDNGSGGLNVGAAVTVSSAASTALPSVAVTTNGTVGVLYDTFDGTEPPNFFPKFTAHLAISTDHAVTFTDTPLEKFTSPCGPAPAPTPCPGEAQPAAKVRVLGDFQQVKANGDLLYGTFSGNRVPFNGGTGTSIIDPIYFSANTAKTPVFAPGGGAFVIGDKSSAIGAHVHFWSAQWSKQNSLSSGTTPASFEGFAKQPTQPSCGAAWTSAPGNSPPPPSGPLPAEMGVIVSSTITKPRSQIISGDTVHIVVVKTDPGYQSNPGHAGTGTVVAQVC